MYALLVLGKEREMMSSQGLCPVSSYCVALRLDQCQAFRIHNTRVQMYAWVRCTRVYVFVCVSLRVYVCI